MLSSAECHLQCEAQHQAPYFFSVVCSGVAGHNACYLTAQGMAVIGGCKDAGPGGEMRPHAHYNGLGCPLPLRELQVKAGHVDESPSEYDLGPPIDDKRAAS